MRFRILAAGAVVLGSAVCSGTAVGQKPQPDILAPVAAGPVGTIRTWQNELNPARAPLTERPPLRLGERNLIPSSPRRDGLTPRVGLYQDYQDNLFFSSKDEADDFVTSIAPGLHYSHSDPRWRLDLDYSLEATKYWNETRLDDAVEAQTGLVLFEARPTDRLSIRVLNLASVFEDPVNQDIPGLVPQRESIVQNVMDTEILYGVSAVERLQFGYGHVLSEVEDPAIDGLMSDLTAGYARRLAPAREIAARYRFRNFSFEGGGDVSSHSMFVRYDENLTQQLLLGAEVGVSVSTEALERVDPIGSARVVVGGHDMSFTAEYNRDVLSSAGIGAPILADSVLGRAEFRLGGGLFATGQVEYTEAQLLTPGANDTDVSIFRPAVWFTYAASEDLHFYLYLSRVWQKIDDTGTSAESNRVTLGLIKTF